MSDHRPIIAAIDPHRDDAGAANLGLLLARVTGAPLLLASAYVGNRLGFHADLTTLYGLYEHGAGIGEWVGWLLSDAAPALLIGLFMISTVAAALGYLISSFVWRWWVAHKRRTRQTRPVVLPEALE